MINSTIPHTDYAAQQKRQRLQEKIATLNILANLQSDSSSSSSSSSSDDDSIVENTDQHEPAQCPHSNINSIPYEPDGDDNYSNENLIDSSFDSSPRLYENSRVSVKAAATTIMSVAIEFDFPKIAVERILKVFKSCLPMPNLLPTTYVSLMKTIDAKSTSTSKYYCNSCSHLCSIRSRRKYCVNNNCRFKNLSLRNCEISEVVTMDIREQIRSIISRNISLFNNDKYFPPFDIKSSSFYKMSASTNQSNKISNLKIHPITLNIHTDGAPVVRTTKSSLWPCLASIVELPPQIREKQTNIVVLCLWLSSVKPDVHLFMHDCIRQLVDLSSPFILFINNEQFLISVKIQLFVSDLPAKALFWKTISYNGYNACSNCKSEGFYQGRQVFYPYTKNNYQLRTHDEFVATARLVEDRQAKRKKGGSIDGIKGLSPLLQIFEYPKQIILDYMHLSCLGHMSTLINRWLSVLNKEALANINSQLFSQRFPHNMSVKFNYPLHLCGDWKAKHFRIFVLSIGVPLVLKHLPQVVASHFTLYSMFIKLLHNPNSIEEIELADKIIHYYCKTAAHIYGESIELFSLHAHLHLPQQVLNHGGLSFTSVFCFESAIRYLKKKAHGTKDLATQIADWISVERTMKKKPFEIFKSIGFNQMDINDHNFDIYREIFLNNIHLLNENGNDIALFLRYRDTFNIYHTVLYDLPYTCVSYIISYKAVDASIKYGQIIVFFKLREEYYALLREYKSTDENISDFVSVPAELEEKLNEIFPIRILSNSYSIVPVINIRHKCIQVAYDHLLFLSEVRVDYEHD